MPTLSAKTEEASEEAALAIAEVEIVVAVEHTRRISLANNKAHLMAIEAEEMVMHPEDRIFAGEREGQCKP